jgi:hypothetical protein
MMFCGAADGADTALPPEAEIREREDPQPEQAASGALFVNHPDGDAQTRQQHSNIKILQPHLARGGCGCSGNEMIGLGEIRRREAGFGEGGNDLNQQCGNQAEPESKGSKERVKGRITVRRRVLLFTISPFLPFKMRRQNSHCLNARAWS